MLFKVSQKILFQIQKKSANQFLANIPNSRDVQEKILLNILSRNKSTVYGKKYEFSLLNNYENFKRRLPLNNYDNLVDYINPITTGERDVLFKGGPLYFEETSGSTSSSKLIPFNKELKRDLHRGVMPWMYQLEMSYKCLSKGPSYWSISPPIKESSKTIDGISLGANTDSNYFNPFIKFFLNNIFAVPNQIKSIADPNKFYMMTLVYLLSKRNLNFISCWSPTFFLQLHDYLIGNVENILRELKKIIPDKRLIFLEEIFKDQFTWKKIWPELNCLSCWTDSTSSIWIPRVQSILGNCAIQGKGLLSTECLTSIPFFKNSDPVLAYRSHFFEFLEWRGMPLKKTDHILTIESLEVLKYYEIVVTTSGGLYRYQTGDLVQITSQKNGLPEMIFMGRKSGWLDIVGEKISEIQAIRAWRKTLNKLNMKESPAYLVGESTINDLPHYTLYIMEDIVIEDKNKISTVYEKLLLDNPYYAQAQKLNQLGKLEIDYLPKTKIKLLAKNFCIQNSISDGNLKHPFLWNYRDFNHCLYYES